MSIVDDFYKQLMLAYRKHPNKLLKDEIKQIKQIPKDIAEMLLEANHDPECQLLIHRGKAKEKDNIFNNGLKIKGGADLNYTTHRFRGDDKNLLLNVARASYYKNPSNEDAICVLIMIPQKYLEYHPGETKPCLFQTDLPAELGGGMAFTEGKQTILLPEFIKSTLLFKNGTIVANEENPNYKEEHDYQNDGLRCPDETLTNYMEKNKMRIGPKNNNKNNNLDVKEALKENIKRSLKEREMFPLVNEAIIRENNKYIEMQRNNSKVGNTNPENINIQNVPKKESGIGNENLVRTENSIKNLLKGMTMSKFKKAFQHLKNLILFKGKKQEQQPLKNKEEGR